jgi:hypothetical protein
MADQTPPDRTQVETKAWLDRRVMVAASIALLAGIALGVVLDRVLLHVLSRNSTRSGLVGRWVDTSGERREFNSDGTCAWEQWYFNPDSGKWISRPHVGQWRWLEDDWIQLKTSFGGADNARVVVDTNVLKLLWENGRVQEYRRD